MNFACISGATDAAPQEDDEEEFSYEPKKVEEEGKEEVALPEEKNQEAKCPTVENKEKIVVEDENVYEVQIGDLKESPMEKDVTKVVMENKTYVVPKEEFLLQEYPLQSDCHCVIRLFNGEKDPKLKSFIVEKKDLTLVQDNE